MFQSEHLQEKWAPLLNAEGCEEPRFPSQARNCRPARKPRKIPKRANAFSNSGMLNEFLPP